MWTGGHIPVRVVDITWADLNVLACMRHLSSQVWIALRWVWRILEKKVYYIHYCHIFTMLPNKRFNGIVIYIHIKKEVSLPHLYSVDHVDSVLCAFKSNCKVREI
jgi:hypothetical protein